MPAYQAIVFDLDGTAVANSYDAAPSPALMKAVRAAKSRLHLICATGRRLDHALPIFRALGLADPCIAAGGSIIADPVSGRILHQASLTQAQLDAILDICRKYPYPIETSDEPFDSGTPATHRQLKAPATMVFVVHVQAADLTPMTQALSQIPGVLATSARAYVGGNHVIHITTAEATKEHAVTWVLKHLSISRSQTIGVGDDDNDVHLFAAVGHRIAMGNGSQQLKAIADEVAPSVDQDGLAWVINRTLSQI